MMRSSKSPDLSLFLLIARIGKTRGLRGEFFLRSFAENPQSLNTFTKFYTLSSSLMEEVDLKTFGQKDVYVLRSELPLLEENEAYWFELIGMDVVNLDEQFLGVVDIVNNYGASDILEITPSSNRKEKILIPFIRNKFIISINKSKNSILVDWEEDY
jgi:ribosomal 30S subunit maturation factor RimM